MTRLPLDLYAEVETADGTRYRWDANQAPGSRIRNFSFNTKIGEGFSDATGQFARRIDLDYPDLGLINTVTFVGADGTVAYEGRIAAMPRELSDSHTIGIQLAGWMAHAKDRKFNEIYVDRRADAWTDIPQSRKASLLAASVSLGDLSISPEGGGLVSAFPNQALGSATAAELRYTMPPGTTAAAVKYVSSVTSLPASWLTRLLASPNEDFTTTLDAYTFTNDSTLRTHTLTTDRRYVGVQVYSNGSAATPAAGSNWRISKVGVYGNHGLTLYAGETGEPEGVYGSDAIRDIASRFCPQLDTSGVQNTSYVIQHLAFPDRTFPYDAFLEINKYHLWHLGVWENKRLDFRPYDLTDYDWEIRTDDPGTTFAPQGPTTESLFNGIAVTYTDLLNGQTSVVTPDDDSTLADTSPTNPWNQHGIEHWDEITLSTPSLQATAVQLGVAALADRNAPKTPGTITIRGYVRDRAGNEQPVWKMRAGQTIAITNFPNDTPRLIVETGYNNEDKSIQLAVDRPFALLDAYLDRLGNAAGARGLA